MPTKAEQHINFIHSFIEYPDWLCENDWSIWRPLVKQACAQVMDERTRKMGFEAITFFNFHFYKKREIMIKKPNVSFETFG